MEEGKERQTQAALEAILFTMGNSVEVDRLARAVELDREQVRAILRGMKERYDSEGRGITLVELEDSFQMCTRPQMYEYLIKIAKTPRSYVLTDTLLETLSIVAYKQPVTRLEVEKIRGVSCDHAINKLLEYELICELGRLDAPGRPLLFGTTEAFLRCFGVKSLDDLPTLNPERIEAFKQEAEEEISLAVTGE